MTVAENGGASILSYELQVYDIEIGSWVELVGGSGDYSLQNTFFFTTSSFGKTVVKGRTYVFRYRAWNINGPGPWSDEGYLTPAQEPGSPSAPIYVFSDAT